MAWKERRQIIAGYQRVEGPFALATLVKSAGSTYRQPGSRMLILPGGPFVGRLSAGCIEEEIADLALAVIDHGEPAAEVLSVANYFCRSARMRIDHHFTGTTQNADRSGYDLTQELLSGKHASLRDGIV